MVEASPLYVAFLGPFHQQYMFGTYLLLILFLKVAVLLLLIHQNVFVFQPCLQFTFFFEDVGVFSL